MEVKTFWWNKSRRAQSDTDFETWVEGGVAPTMNSFDNGDSRATTIVFKPHQQDGARIQDDVINTLTAQMGTGGNNVPMVAFAIDSEGGNSMKSKNPNSGCNEVSIANTITTMTPDPSDYRGGNAIVNNNSKQVRRLTPKECERLQGFPDDWTISQSDSARYKQMGNAVAVPVVDWLIKGML